MSQEMVFETGKYKFKVYKIETAPNLVQVDIMLKPLRDITPEDVNETEEMLKHIGKWEDLINAGKALLKDLGLAGGVDI
jgi:hypothetical protein